MDLNQFLATTITGETAFAEFAAAFTARTGLADDDALSTALTERGLLNGGVVACGLRSPNVAKMLTHFIARSTGKGTMLLADFTRRFCGASGVPYSERYQAEIAELLESKQLLTGDLVLRYVR